MRKPFNLNSINQVQKEEASTEQLSRGRSINSVPAAVEEVLRQTESSQSAPAPGIPEGSAVTKRDKTQRLSERFSLCRAVLKRMVVFLRVQRLRLCCLPGRNRTSAESHSPENSQLILQSPEQVYRNNFFISRRNVNFEIYEVLINRSISRTELQEKMDEDFIIKIMNSRIFYKDYFNKNNSLKYLINKSDIKYNKSINLKEEHNETFNRFLYNLDIETKEQLKLKNQLAFIRFRKKDGSFEVNKEVYKKSDLPKEEHTEDKIFEQLLQIYYEDDCCYSEIYIFSTNSPCLARDNHVPCMIQAFVLAKLLYEKHGIKTIIGYLKPWGFSGPYDKQLSKCPIKDNSPQTTTTDKIDIELIITLYKQSILEIENLVFSMKDTNSTKTNNPKPKLDLAQFCLKISKTENRENCIKKLNKIVSYLFLTEDSNKTFAAFRQCGLERFEQCMTNIDKLLNEINSNICEEIREYLKKYFFPWLDKKVEDAFSKFLKQIATSWFLQERAVCLFLKEIPETEPFFNIGYVSLENVII